MEAATKYNKIYKTQLIADPWILGKLPKIDIYLESDKKVEINTVANRSNKGKSRGVLVIITLPERTQEKDHNTINSKTAEERRTNLGISKNSVVKVVKSSGIKAVTKTKIPKITRFMMAERLVRI